MASITSGVLQIVRDWLQSQGASTPLTDAQVILANAKAPRPPLPYLTVKITVADVPVGPDEVRGSISGGVPQAHAVGHRTGTVSINAYGDGALEWLERAHRRLHLPTVLRSVLSDPDTGEGITLVALGGITDLSQLVDTEIEPRYLREYTVAYDVSDLGDEQALVEAATIVTEMTYESDAPAGDLTDTITA